MKKRYVSPGIHVQHFMANEYIANCETEWLVVVEGCGGQTINLIIDEYSVGTWTDAKIVGTSNGAAYPASDGTWIYQGSIFDDFHNTDTQGGEYQIAGWAEAGKQQCTLSTHMDAVGTGGFSEYTLHHHFTQKKEPVKNHS